MRPRRSPSWRRHAPWAIAALLHLALGLVLYTNTSPDDTHITYGAAQRLLRHGAITNYNGDRIEQSSSLAHVVLTALGCILTGAAVPTVGHVIGVLAGLACLPLVQRVARRVAPRASAAAPVFVATLGPFLYWSFGGLEATVFAFFALACADVVPACVRRPGPRRTLAAAACLFAFGTTRPEASLVAVAALIGLAAIALVRTPGGLRSRLRAARPELAVLGVALACAGAVALVHLVLGGHLLPNAARAKSHKLFLDEGVAYVWRFTGWGWSWAAVLLAVASRDIALRAGVRGRARVASEQLVALLVVVYLFFIVAVGGDWMWGGRFLANVAPLAGLLAAAGATRLVDFLREKSPFARALPSVAWAATLAVANTPNVLFIAETSRAGRPVWRVPRMRAMVAERFPGSRYAWLELASAHNLRDTPVAEALRDVLDRAGDVVGGRVVVASRQAGFTIYHAMDATHASVHFVDLDNLATDDYLDCGGEFLHRNTHGAILTYDLLLHPPPRLAASCPRPRPHVIFDVSRQEAPTELEGAGYVLVFMQRGEIGKSPWFVGRNAAFIAVDGDLASRASLSPVTVDPFDYQWADINQELLRLGLGRPLAPPARAPPHRPHRD